MKEIITSLKVTHGGWILEYLIDGKNYGKVFTSKKDLIAFIQKLLYPYVDDGL